MISTGIYYIEYEIVMFIGYCEYQQYHMAFSILSIEGPDTSNDFLEIIRTTNRLRLTEYLLCVTVWKGLICFLTSYS